MDLIPLHISVPGQKRPQQLSRQSAADLSELWRAVGSGWSTNVLTEHGDNHQQDDSQAWGSPVLLPCCGSKGEQCKELCTSQIPHTHYSRGPWQQCQIPRARVLPSWDLQDRQTSLWAIAPVWAGQGRWGSLHQPRADTKPAPEAEWLCPSVSVPRGTEGHHSLCWQRDWHSLLFPWIPALERLLLPLLNSIAPGSVRQRIPPPVFPIPWLREWLGKLTRQILLQLDLEEAFYLHTIFFKVLSFLPMAALFTDVLYPFLSSSDICASWAYNKKKGFLPTPVPNLNSSSFLFQINQCKQSTRSLFSPASLISYACNKWEILTPGKVISGLTRVDAQWYAYHQTLHCKPFTKAVKQPISPCPVQSVPWDHLKWSPSSNPPSLPLDVFSLFKSSNTSSFISDFNGNH